MSPTSTCRDHAEIAPRSCRDRLLGSRSAISVSGLCPPECGHLQRGPEGLQRIKVHGRRLLPPAVHVRLRVPRAVAQVGEDCRVRGIPHVKELGAAKDEVALEKVPAGVADGMAGGAMARCGDWVENAGAARAAGTRRKNRCPRRSQRSRCATRRTRRRACCRAGQSSIASTRAAVARRAPLPRTAARPRGGKERPSRAAKSPHPPCTARACRHVACRRAD